ncbi:hypothetical protein CEXT_769151 [Caerostris extrusa]|uniref:Uncharacterized protein n=1 Tax=Caerostris extrusa TaxID=172846 RepID=A0AAV4Y6D1_CAEEX|nr:hypothetical protein CEXT_769151 [Caerostris extrusa]
MYLVVSCWFRWEMSGHHRFQTVKGHEVCGRIVPGSSRSVPSSGCLAGIRMGTLSVLSSCHGVRLGTSEDSAMQMSQGQGSPRGLQRPMKHGRPA